MENFLVLLNVVAASAGLIAAVYWFKASRTNLPPFDKSTGVPTGQVSMGSIGRDIVAAVTLNRIAASWSCAAAVCTASSLFLGTFFK